MTGWVMQLGRSARALARRPGFTAVAVATLALGVGATVAIFTVVHAVLLEPLPFDESDRVVVVVHHAPGLDLPELENSGGTGWLYMQHARAFESYALVDELSANLEGPERPERVQLLRATPSAFRVFRVEATRGRLFTEEEATGERGVALLTDRGWEALFGRDPEVVGRTVELDGRVTEIVGVLPAAFTLENDEPVAVVPMRVDGDSQFGTFGLAGFGRLAEGHDLASATREVEALQARIPELFPDVTPAFLERAGWSTSVVTARERVVGDVQTALWVVLGTVGFVLLIACANVANLFLVRAESRQREVAVRRAMGAGRAGIAGLFLNESLLVGLAAGAVGLFLARVGVDALVAAGPEALPRLHEVSVDATVVAFAALLVVGSALAFGAIPALRYAGRRFAGILNDGSRGSTAGRERQRARNVLVAGQFALALVLLVGSGLMLRSAARLRAVDPGFEPEGVLTMALNFGDHRTRPEAMAFYDRVLERIRALPGVEEAGATNAIPLLPAGVNGGSFRIESRPRGEEELPPVAMYAVVTPGYFEAMGIPVVEGRTVGPADHGDGAAAVWVNETFVRTFLDGAALGERVALSEEDFSEVVGVVGDVRLFGLDEDIRPTLFFPMAGPSEARLALASLTLAIATSGSPGALAPAVREVVREVNGSVPITRVRSMEEVVDESLASTSFTLVLLAIAAGVALVLGAVGVYGVLAYVVGQRTREIGIRIALGARAADVRSLVVRQGLAVTGVGVVVGLGAAFILSRSMTNLLYEVSPWDPVTFVTVPALLVAVAVAACWVPARRAARVQPVEALVSE